MFFRMNFKQIPNEREFGGWPFQETYEYYTIFYKCRLRVLKRTNNSGIEIGLSKTCRLIPLLFWRELEKFGKFYRMMLRIGIINHSILSSYVVLENLDRDYVLKKWGVDARGLREDRDDKLNQILN